MKVISNFFARQNEALGRFYDAETGEEFRAGNLCNLMLGYVTVMTVLIAFALLVDLSSMSVMRMFYFCILTAMVGMLVWGYFSVLKGHFRRVRFWFIAVSIMFLLPAVLLTGGFPNSPAIFLFPVPLLYTFALYKGHQSTKIALGFIGLVVVVALLSPVLSVNLPNFSLGDKSSGRKIVNFFILVVLTLFTLLSLQHETKRAVDKAQAAARVKSEFLANMSHEIRTPMNGVMGITEVLMSKPMPEDQKELLRIVSSSGDALLTIINDILDFSKLDAGQIELDPAEFNLKMVLKDIFKLLKLKIQEKRLSFKFEYNPECPSVFIGDDGRLRQILLNLIGNAIKFTESGGVKVSVNLGADQMLQIDVQDTGIGIEADNIDYLFEQFTQAETSTTRRFGGTGLGLTISRRLARIMGGDIYVQSEFGKGSTFSLKLPLPAVTTSIAA